MKADIVTTNFTSGEISPLMMGRNDVQKYQNGAKEVFNYIVRTQGGVTRRSGGVVEAQAKDSSGLVRLHTFEFSETEAFLMEFGNFYVRIHVDGITVDVVTPYTSAQVHALSFDQSGDVVYICHPSHKQRTLSRYSNTNWVLATYETEDGPYSNKSGPQDSITVQLTGKSDTATLKSTAAVFTTVGRYVEFPDKDGAWSLAQITAVISSTEATVNRITNIVEDLSYETYIRSTGTISSAAGAITPSAAITVSGSGPYTITSTASDVFTKYDVGKYVRANASGTFGWYLITSFTSSSVVVAAASAITLDTYTYPTIRVTESNRFITGTLTSSAALFVATDIGRQVRLDFSAAITWGTITTFTNTTTVGVTLKKTIPLDPNDPTKIPNNGIATDWKLGALSETTGWPRCVALHQQRLVFAGTVSEPQSLWLSETDDYVSFATTEDNSEVLDTSGISITLFSGRANTIVWMSSGPTLLVGTTSSEWQLRPSNAVNEALTPTNFSLTRQSRIGSHPRIPGILVGSAVMFIQRSGTRCWSLAYDYSIDAYDGTDLTVISDHILPNGRGVLQFCHQKEPFSHLWFVLNDGTAAVLTYEKKQEVYGWSRHTFAGPDAAIESVTTMPSLDYRGERIFAVVKRTIQGQTVRTIERLDYLDGCQVDGAAAASNTQVVSGLTWMEGEDVRVVADGIDRGEFTVTGGSIDLGDVYDEICVGFHYDSYVHTVPAETNVATGSTVGRLRRAHQVGVRLYNTYSLDYWESDGEPIRKGMDDIDFVTGIVKFNPGLANDEEGTIKIGQTLPYPSTLLSVVTNLTFGSLV